MISRSLRCTLSLTGLVGAAFGVAASPFQGSEMDAQRHEAWPNIDDPVMGGRSRSRMSLEDGVAVFAGAVSLENNGGFASVRSRPAEHPLAGFEGVALRVRGDGKTYKMRLRATETFDGVSYQASFATEPGRWIEIDWIKAWAER